MCELLLKLHVILVGLADLPILARRTVQACIRELLGVEFGERLLPLEKILAHASTNLRTSLKLHVFLVGLADLLVRRTVRACIAERLGVDVSERLPTALAAGSYSALLPA